MRLSRLEVVIGALTMAHVDIDRIHASPASLDGAAHVSVYASSDSHIFGGASARTARFDVSDALALLTLIDRVHDTSDTEDVTDDLPAAISKVRGWL